MNKKQGESSVTVDKQQNFRVILAKQYSIITRILHKYSHNEYEVMHLDTNAGCGKDSKGNYGSPIIFLETIRKYDISSKIRCIFIEKDKKLHASLVENINNYLNKKTCKCVPDIRCGDNELILPECCNDIYNSIHKKKIYGLFYHDPNGQPNFNLLEMFAKRTFFSRVDILVNLNTVTLKRICKCSVMPEESKISLESFVKNMSKYRKRILIRIPFCKQFSNSERTTTWDFCFLLFTNWTDYPEFRKIAFYDLNSPEGQAIFFHVNYTQEEKKAMNSPADLEKKALYEKLIRNQSQLLL